jgi:transcriptional regulator with PAS, ATPase and Fis domain
MTDRFEIKIGGKESVVCIHPVSFNDIKDIYFRYVLDFHEGNRSKAAKSLGVSVRTMQRWIYDKGDDFKR